MITQIVTNIASTYHLKHRSDRYVGPCPKCGGSNGSDKFNIRDDGGFKCYGCDFKGDIITWLKDIEGLKCQEAHERAGIVPCASTSCAIFDTCRLGKAEKRAYSRPKNSLTMPQGRAAELPTIAAKSPQQKWQEWASQLVITAAANLAKEPHIIEWLLKKRGIKQPSIDQFKLGYLSHDFKVKRSDIGLAPREGKTTMWVPGGLVIPTFAADGNIHRLRIRRTVEAMEKFLPDLKYVWLEGSGTAPMELNTSAKRGAVIVEAELDGLAITAENAEVMVIALGSVSAGITSTTREKLATMPVILVCLDADGKTADGKPGAGPKAVKTWLSTYRQARFWPVPTGKDPGDYVAAGGDLHGWIEAGLPPVVSPASPSSSHDSALPPGNSQQGDGGKEIKHYIMTIPGGHEAHITDDRATWERLSEQGLLVFSEQELKRLQPILAPMAAEEKLQAIETIVATKQLFPRVYYNDSRIENNQNT